MQWRCSLQTSRGANGRPHLGIEPATAANPDRSSLNGSINIVVLSGEVREGIGLAVLAHIHRVWIIDDDSEVLVALGGALRLLGCEVNTCSDGREALERMGVGPPACVTLLDLLLPECSGWEVRERMTRHPVLRHVPVIGITALPSSDWHPFEGPILPKPVSWNELVERLDRLPCLRRPPTFAS
jgi:CheY-like chemotaxis protein